MFAKLVLAFILALVLILAYSSSHWYYCSIGFCILALVLLALVLLALVLVLIGMYCHLHTGIGSCIGTAILSLESLLF